MATCVIAADTLNEGYQSMEVWYGGRARIRGRREERGRSVGEIRAKKKVVEIEEKRMSHKKRTHLRGTSSWEAFQQPE